MGEYTGIWNYYATDALGSVRQIVDASGTVQFAQSYEPYGDVLASIGSGGGNYGYAGEWTDSSGMQYLRARYYDTGIGRFLTRDTWAGDYYDPLSLNRWGYVQGNPVNYVDPSGMYYNRAAAAQYAMNWDHQSAIDPEYDFTQHAAGMDWSNQCTMFASSILHYGGIRETRSDPIKSGNPDYDPSYWNIDVLKEGGLAIQRLFRPTKLV